ncbi:MAG TPA: HesA/MoeB/ThiF family protein [Pirellulaceae bacterium]
MLPELTADEHLRYRWQLWLRDFGEDGQRRLKQSTVLVSRIGGVGGTIAMQLAAAGIGRLILVHAGNLRLDDLNRQLLMTTDGIGKPRIESAVRTLQAINPHVQIETVAENISEQNAAALVERCDVAASAAPLFSERLLMNREAVRQRKPLVDGAMYDLEGRLMTIVPSQTPCLACLYPETPPNWKREFPVISPIASTVGCLAAMEVIKVLTGLGQPLTGKLLTFDLRDMSFQTVAISRQPNCPVCGA